MPDLIDAFASYARQERMLQPSTVARYVDVVRKFATYAEGLDPDRPLHALAADELSEFLRSYATDRDEQPSKALWNIGLSALRAFYGHLFKLEVISANPALRIDRQRVRPTARLTLSFDEMIGVLDAVDTGSAGVYRSRNVAIFQVLFQCGIRVAELVSLNRDQVDFTNRVFHAVKAKGGKRLSLAFNDVVAEALELYLTDTKTVQPREREAALFVSNRGTRMSVRAVQNLVRDYARRAGIMRPVTPHLFRHSNVTTLVDMGTPLHVVQRYFDHESITTTQRYSHARSAQTREAGDQLASAWRSHVREHRREDRRNTG